jgi:hypothetical protein
MFTVQTMSGLPALPPGRNLIGQAYRIVASPGATLPDGSVSIQYLQNDLLTAGVVDEDLEMYFYDGSAWFALDTAVDDYYNLTSAASQGAGVYALFASIRISLAGDAWNIFAYPLRDNQATAAALESISGDYSLVYGFDGTTPDQPWRVYDPSLPAGFDYVNTLDQLQFGSGYWIYALFGTTMYFGAPPALSPEAGWLPVTLYGKMTQDELHTIGGGVPLYVYQNGSLKGTAMTQVLNDMTVYSIQVMLDQDDGPVTIQANSYFTRDIQSWLETDTNRIDLPYQQWNIFLPMLIR